MKKLFGFTILFFLFLSRSVSGQIDSGLYYSGLVSSKGLEADITLLASPELKGRGSGNIGLELAARYIRKQFREAGLKPYFPGYAQAFYLKEDSVLPAMTIGRHEYTFGLDYHSFSPKSKRKIVAKEIVFVNEHFEQWNSDSVVQKDKVVIFIPGLLNLEDTSLRKISACIQKAGEMKARAILIPDYRFLFKSDYQGINELNDKFRSSLSADKRLPVFSLSWKVINDLLGEKQFDSLLHNFKTIDLRAFKKQVPVRIQYKRTPIGKAMFNTAGFIPGKINGQYLVVGAHYDHVGETDGKIYPGADDNASGTSALLQMARIYSEAYKQGHIPERSILFVTFTGEEKGLLGSNHFVNSLPSKDTISAMINMDMIGRSDGSHNRDYVFVVGWDYYEKFWKNVLNESTNDLPGFEPDFSIRHNNDPEFLMTRSDQYPFLLRKIPVLFFHDGMRTDYHLPTDTAEKIDWNLLKKRVQFIFLMTWKLAFKNGELCDCD